MKFTILILHVYCTKKIYFFLTIYKKKIYDTECFTFYFIEANKHSEIEQTGLVPMPTILGFRGNNNDLPKRCLPPELKDLQTVIKSVLLSYL